MPFVVDKDKFTVHLSNNSTGFTVYFYGATVTSWVVNGQEQLFLSKNAILNGTKAIRGGIPLVFPQFGSVEGSKLPQHGFARCSFWKLTNYTEIDDQIKATLTLTPNEVDLSLRAIWNYDFRLDYQLVLTGSSGTLETSLIVANMDVRQFDFTWLLHTYIRVPLIGNMEVHGLDGCTYSDKTRELNQFTQSGALTVTEEVDRVFAKVIPVSKPLTVHIEGKNLLTVERTIPKGHVGFADVVTWNPWVEKAKSMADYGDNEFLNMICVEVGDVANNVVVKPGEIREAGQVLHAVAAIAKL